MRATAWLLIGLVGLGLTRGDGPAQDAALPAPEGVVLYLRLADEPITPVTERFILRAVRDAAAQGAAAVVIELDTPGGLMASTQNIVKGFLASPVPVVVYVAPAGGRAASAGVFITLAAHVAAMAPGTHIGAAHPVSVGGTPLSPSAPADTSSGAAGQDVMGEKVVNDAVAWARSLAELRGRNADWAAQSVAASESITATEALARDVVDLLAPTLGDLLDRIDGREVVTATGPVTLRTAGAAVAPVQMWWGERLLGVLSNPNVAFLLLMLGFYGILFEFYTPGWGVGGTLGAICLVLGFFGLAVLPVNYAGLALIGLAMGLFVAEAFFTSYGALTLGGAVCLILGGIMLIDTPIRVLRVSTGVLVPVALATAAITFFLVGSVVRAHRARVQTGSEVMRGAEAVAREAFAPADGGYAGLVTTHGELWRAVSPTPVSAGAVLTIDDRDGLTLYVHDTGRVRPQQGAPA